MDVVQIAVSVALVAVVALVLWRVVRAGLRMGVGVAGITLLLGGLGMLALGGLVYAGYFFGTSWLGIEVGAEWIWYWLCWMAASAVGIIGGFILKVLS